MGYQKGSPYTINTILLLLFCIFPYQLALSDTNDITPKLFEETLSLRKDEYRKARSILVSKGNTILPFLKEKLNSPNQNEQILAEILIDRITRPEKISEWDKMLMTHSNSRYTNIMLEKRDNWSDLDFELVDVPISYQIDCLREEHFPMYVAVQFYLNPRIELVDPLLELARPNSIPYYAAQQGLPKLGQKIKEPMRQRIKMAIATIPDSAVQFQKRDVKNLKKNELIIHTSHQALLAAQVLTELNDRESIPLMIACMKKFQIIDRYQYGKPKPLESISQCLSQLKATEGIDLMIDQLISTDRNGNYFQRPEERYDTFRQQIIDLGQIALPILQDRYNRSSFKRERTILQAVIADISLPDGKEKEAARIKETLIFQPTVENYMKLHSITGDDVFVKLIDIYRGIRVRDKEESFRACQALGKLKEIHAIPVLLETIQTNHERLVSRNLLDQTSNSSNQSNENYIIALRWINESIIALRDIGNDSARKAIQSIVDYPEAKSRATISLLFLDGKMKDIEKYLDSNNSELREEAVFALKDSYTRKVTTELFRIASQKNGKEYSTWKDYALKDKINATAILQQFASEGSIREKVLAQVVLAEIEHPEKAKNAYKIINQGRRQVNGMHALSISDCVKFGKPLALKLKPDHLPFIQAQCLFGDDWAEMGIAATILGEEPFKSPESLAVLKESLSNTIRGYTNDYPASMAIAQYNQDHIQ